MKTNIIKTSGIKFLLLNLLLIRCASSQPNVGGIYQPSIKTDDPSFKKPLSAEQSPSPQLQIVDSFTGSASWYGPGFHGKKTASGEIFDENSLTAAHRSIALGTKVRITNLRNNKSVIATINDRGPFIGNRVLDGSKKVASDLDFLKDGVTEVKVDVLADKYAAQNKAKAGLFQDNPVASAVQKYSAPAVATTNPNNLSADKIYVQLGAFSVKNNSVEFSKSIASQFRTLPVQQLYSGNIYRVAVGPYNSRDEAEQVFGQLAQNGLVGVIKEMNPGSSVN